MEMSVNVLGREHLLPGWRGLPEGENLGDSVRKRREHAAQRFHVPAVLRLQRELLALTQNALGRLGNVLAQEHFQLEGDRILSHSTRVNFQQRENRGLKHIFPKLVKVKFSNPNPTDHPV